MMHKEQTSDLIISRFKKNTANSGDDDDAIIEAFVDVKIGVMPMQSTKDEKIDLSNLLVSKDLGRQTKQKN